LSAATAGEGGVVYVEGASASGKSRLMAEAAEGARAAGMKVLDARGHDLEGEFSFGVAIQLFEEAWFAVSERERAVLLEGPARSVGELISGSLSGGHGLAGDLAYVVIHGLFWLARTLAADATDGMPERGLALIVDDVDCADGPSLRFLAYLASRIAHLPIAAVVAARPVPLGADAPALSALRGASELIVLETAGSSPSAVADAAPRSWLQRTLETAPATEAGAGSVGAQMALRKSLAGGHRESVIDLAEMAWGGGALLESDEDAYAWPAVAEALVFVDELERAIEIADAASRVGPAGSLPRAAHPCRGWSLYHQGRINEALAVAKAAVAAKPDGAAARGLFAACSLAQGRLDEAEAVLSIVPGCGSVEEIYAPVLLDVRAQLSLAQIRPADALADALEAGRRSRGSWGVIGPGVVAWRSTAALAQLALGETRQARALAQEELELAREQGLRRVVMRDLRILAVAAEAARTLELLAEAVRVGRAAPPRLEYVNALVDLGAATRRANQRTAARPPLREGVELAEHGGATALARRASEELVATGARSRRVILRGIEALTPSERRVADLAAGGLTTRQIAHVLFVTPKTVEFHLRHVYRKLDIPSSRADLARALSVAASGKPRERPE
jgi:DNA-binding CsgD family transcriptional regulator